MPVTWFQSQQMAEAPVAPLSSQQAAARWEPSIQDFVTEIGGYTIDDLQKALENQFTTKFQVAKVWKAMDAISDKGLQSYLQHHWVIMKMTPADDQSAETANPQNQAAIDPCSTAKQVDESPTCSPELSRATVPSQKKQKIQVDLEGIDDAPNNEDQPPAPQSDGMTGMISSGMQMDADAQSTDHISTTEQRIVQEGPLGDRLLESESANTKLSTETKLDPEQAQDLQPDKDHGLQLARDGQLWFLRIDRFNEADKWFACGTFENALQSEQARNKHYAPKAEVTFEKRPGKPELLLDYLVPTLQRLAIVKYSVFAKGNHCQWHARVLTVLATSLSHFLDPFDLEEKYLNMVTQILIDGKEQQRYAAMAGKFGGPDNAYLRSFPEAPYLKPAISDVKALAGRGDGTNSKRIAQKSFPDLKLVYSSMGA